MERAYTVKEIDALRKVCNNVWLFGPSYYSGAGYNRYGRSYKEPEKTACVEEMVRTYMIAGVTAQDIIDEYSQR